MTSTSHGAFKAKLAKLDALRAAPADALLPGLRKALTERTNYLIAKAAAIAAERYATALLPELLATFDRLFDQAATVDPLALGKNAIAKALKELDCRDPAVFMRGLQHVQLEGAWGPPVDAAAALRGTCALALVGCDIPETALLEAFVDHLFTDGEKTVRGDVVRAIADVGGAQSMLLLRAKALAGDPEPEVIGECFVSLMNRQPRESLTFIERFLEHENAELQFEAVCALAGSREATAQTAVARYWATGAALEVRHAIIFSCAASAAPEATNFLLSIVSEPRPELAISALSALASSRFRNDVAARARTAAEKTRDANIIAAYAAAFGSTLE